jgi:thiamine-monophosphate kinase
VARPGEFQFIERFTRPFLAGEGVQVGIGDDAAVLRPPPRHDLVATVDAVVEGIHFGSAFSPEEVGWKSLAVNLSDLAAMGARPLWALVAIATPPGADPLWLERVGRGIARCARRHRTSVVGGNVTAARQTSVTVTVLGAVRRGRALLRSGARPGDLVVVSGTLGDAALGLQPGAASALRDRQRRPRPRLALGQGAVGIARAAIDISDGLLQDLAHLCEASGTGARVEVERLPLSPGYRAATKGRVHPHEEALSGGEDYELLLAVPPSRLTSFREAARLARTPVAVIGEIESRGGLRVVKGEGDLYRPRRVGHDHFRSGHVLGPGPRRA